MSVLRKSNSGPAPGGKNILCAHTNKNYRVLSEKQAQNRTLLSFVQLGNIADVSAGIML